MKLRAVQFSVGLILLIALEFMRSDFKISGTPSSESTDLSNFIQSNIFYLRTIGILIILFPMVNFFWTGSRRTKFLAALGLVTYVIIFYVFHFQSR